MVRAFALSNIDVITICVRVPALRVRKLEFFVAESTSPQFFRVPPAPRVMNFFVMGGGGDPTPNPPSPPPGRLTTIVKNTVLILSSLLCLRVFEMKWLP